MESATRTGRLVVEIDGLRNDRGHVLAAVYDDPEAFPNDGEAARRTGKTDIRGRNATLAFEDLPVGTYAVALLHDENDDGKMNKTRFGLPTEGFGLSGVDKIGLRPPEFAASAFRYDGGEQTVRIAVQYLL